MNACSDVLTRRSDAIYLWRYDIIFMFSATLFIRCVVVNVFRRAPVCDTAAAYRRAPRTRKRFARGRVVDGHHLARLRRSA